MASISQSSSNSSDHVVVTGAAGFIGSHMVDRLLATGHRVTGIDNLVRGTRENLEQAGRSPGFTLIEANLHDPGQCRQAFASAHAEQPVSMVWHLAANSDIEAGVSDPEVDLRDTFLTTFQVLGAMRRLGIPALAFASTSAVYGDLDEDLTEDSGPLFPISNYWAMKLACEGAISAARESYLQQAWIFRFPNVVGGRGTHGVIFDLLRRLSTPGCRELEVKGDGSQQKPYLHVSELLDAMLYIIGRTGSTRLNYYNISGNDEGTTVRFIAETIVSAAAPGTPIRYTGGKKGWVGDVPRFRYSTAKLASLGWKPRLSSDDAVRRAVAEMCAQIRSHEVA
jgi:UDP-glucose 4-epimerase